MCVGRSLCARGEAKDAAVLADKIRPRYRVMHIRFRAANGGREIAAKRELRGKRSRK